MATSNKSKKILEKARKIAAKTKKKKVSKVDVKKKTTSYPEGQNAPQSKKYTQESDKALSAKSTGWRWTKEGAKKLGKSVESKPTTSDIEKYRNETFKLKGKPNKSGPKGVGDGSHRYLYVERRADKADITRKNKLMDGGMMAKGGDVNRYKIIQDTDGTYEQGFYCVIDTKEDKLVDLFQFKKEAQGFLDEINQKGISNANSSKYNGQKDNYEDGGEMAKGGMVKEINFDGTNWYLTYIDPTHFFLSNDASLKGNPYHIGQFRTRPFYNEIKEWLSSYKDTMAKGGKIPSSEVTYFKKYVKEFYGKDEMYSEFFPPFGATNDEVNLAVSQYIEYCKTKDDQWGGGDSFDREIVRDIMFYNRGTRKGLEYQRAIKEIFGKDKKEYGGILQPMIGGVNADPRFDIYNTTMFAKKGAELPKGYFEYVSWEEVQSDPSDNNKGYIYGINLIDEDSGEIFDVEWFKSEKERDKAIEEYNLVEYDYSSDDDNYAKGGKTKKASKTPKVDNGDLVRYAQTNDQLKVLKDIIPVLDEKGIKLKYGTSVGKQPQTIIFDKNYHDGILRISSSGWYGENTYNGEEFGSADDLEYVIDNPSDDDYAKGGTVKPRVVPMYIYELSYSKHGKEGTFVDKVKAKSEDDAINKWVDQTHRGKGGVYTIIDVVKSSRNRMEDGGEMAHGGSTHEQGYDDREDESLAMRHGKIASKHFVGSHARREHSRRDDAQFEERHKKAYGGLTDSSIELLD
jgi:hypothetical protein